MPPLDEILWLGVRSSGRREDYEALLDLFPDSKHAEKARHALTKGPLAYALGGSSTELEDIHTIRARKKREVPFRLPQTEWVALVERF